MYAVAVEQMNVFGVVHNNSCRAFLVREGTHFYSVNLPFLLTYVHNTDTHIYIHIYIQQSCTLAYHSFWSCSFDLSVVERFSLSLWSGCQLGSFTRSSSSISNPPISISSSSSSEWGKSGSDKSHFNLYLITKLGFQWNAIFQCI